jgi:hypothetical protein
VGLERGTLSLVSTTEELLGRSGRAIAEAVSHWLPTAAARVNPGCGQVGFMVDKVASGQVFSEYFCFPCYSFHQNSPSSQSPGASTIGQRVADVASGPSLDSTPHYANLKILL